MALAPKVKMAILRDNLEAQSKDFDKLSQTRYAYLDDISRVADDFLLSAEQNGELLSSAYSLLGEWCREEKSIFSNRHCFSSITLDDQYVFSNLLAKRLIARHQNILQTLFPAAENSGRVAFVRNKATEECFYLIKDDFAFKQSVYSVDFKEATLKVLEDEADFCLLPYAENGYFPIYGVFDAVMRAELCLIGIVQTEELVYGIYSKGFSVAPRESLILQYAYSSEMSIPLGINIQVVEKFSYKHGNQFLKVDTLYNEDYEFVVSALLYFCLFAPEVKITGCANVNRI